MQKLIACAAILTLAACAAPNTPGAPAVTPETVNSEPAAPLAAPTEKVVTITSAKPKITSAQLLGRDGDWLKSRLGKPAFVRSEKTANIWQYKNHVCVLNVFLYVEGDDAVPHVLHFDARNIKGDNTDRDRCLAMLQN